MIQEKTGETPKALLSMPRLGPGHRTDLDAFLLISPGRSQTMTGALGPLPLTEITSYLEVFPVRDRFRFVRLMRRLDLEYMKAHKAKQTRLSDKKQEAGNG